MGLHWVEWRMRLWYGGMRKGKEGGREEMVHVSHKRV